MRLKYSQGFKAGDWCKRVDVADFIRTNFTEYCGNADFLAGISPRTKVLLDKFAVLEQQEKDKGGVLDVDTENVSSLLSYKAGYLDKDNEIIVGLQTESPLCRGVNPFGGIRMVEQACSAYGYTLSNNFKELFKYKTTHNDGVFRVYTDSMRKLRHNGVITGLPDAYGRGRIIGDYRRVALYGVDTLIYSKHVDMERLAKKDMSEEVIRLREEVFRQIDFLGKLKEMALIYGIDISAPAKNALEATQWLYFAYLASIKEQNGAAMSLGRVSTFLDIYIKRDIDSGAISEAEAQEIVDQFVLKLRMTRQLRTPDYNEIFAGDPNWVTEALAGMCKDGRSMVTRTTFRFINTLYTLGTSPEPNLTILYSQNLPEEFKRFALKASIDTSSIQYENDDIMRPIYGDDYGIACCVSAMTIGKQMQYFGARCNLAKLLLLSLNGGKDELNGEQIAPLCSVPEGVLGYDSVLSQFEQYIDWLAKEYVNIMNVIHYMHDKYAYEKIQMALHDTNVERLMAFGIAGLSVVADSLSAIKYAKVTPVRENGLTVDFNVEGEFPKFGNDDDRVDQIAAYVVERFYKALTKHKTYRKSVHTLSLLTITSNVVYGKKTGSTPDGRKQGEPFAPGASPMHGREQSGALASLNSVAKLSYDCCRDGISNTFSITPHTLGQCAVDNLVSIVGGYFKKGAHHLNVNVLNRSTLEDAMQNPQNYPNLTIRVSGYAVNFVKLNRKQQLEVLARTFHDKI